MVMCAFWAVHYLTSRAQLTSKQYYLLYQLAKKTAPKGGSSKCLKWHFTPDWIRHNRQTW